jgi:glucose/arabinose dehydrogenase
MNTLFKPAFTGSHSSSFRFSAPLLLLCLLCTGTLALQTATAIELEDILNEPGSTPASRQAYSTKSPILPTTAEPDINTADFKNAAFATKLTKPEDMVINPNALVLDFKEALNLGIHNNLVLAIMEHNTKRSKAAKLESISNLLPDLQFYYRQSRFVGGIQIFDGNPRKAYNHSTRI